jgi:hypothetical protein
LSDGVEGVQILDKIRVTDHRLASHLIVPTDGGPLLHPVVGGWDGEYVSQVAGAGADLDGAAVGDAIFQPMNKFNGRQTVAAILVTPEAEGLRKDGIVLLGMSHGKKPFCVQQVGQFETGVEKLDFHDGIIALGARRAQIKNKQKARGAIDAAQGDADKPVDAGWLGCDRG